MFTLGQASSFNGSHVTFPSQAVVGTVVQPLVISSGSYNTANPPSKSLTLFIEVGLFSVSPNFVDLYMQSDGPLQEDTEEGVQSSAQFLFFYFYTTHLIKVPLRLFIEFLHMNHQFYSYPANGWKFIGCIMRKVYKIAFSPNSFNLRKSVNTNLGSIMKSQKNVKIRGFNFTDKKNYKLIFTFFLFSLFITLSLLTNWNIVSMCS